jgi:hypothetical protein
MIYALSPQEYELGEDTALTDPPAAWRSRQQLRALYFALEEDGLIDLPMSRMAQVVD